MIENVYCIQLANMKHRVLVWFSVQHKKDSCTTYLNLSNEISTASIIAKSTHYNDNTSFIVNMLIEFLVVHG